MLKKTAIAVVVLGTLAGLTWYAYSRVTRAHREAEYAAAMAVFQRDLRVGMTRGDVDEYLRSRSVPFNAVQYGGSNALTYEVKVGEEPEDGIVCEPWSVYIAMEFTDTDRLSDIHLRKVGTCL